MSELLKRQSGLITDEQRELKIAIVGAGGIGSHTALALARMGFYNLHIYDDDVVDEHNCSSQGFDYPDIGSPKVRAVMKKIIAATRTVPKVHNKKITEANIDELADMDIIIMAVDSMEARRMMLDKFSGLQNTSAFLINPSMGGEYMNIDVLEGGKDDFALYLSTLFTDDNAVQDNCTSKATIYTTLIIGSFLCKMVKDIATENTYVHNVCYDIKNNSPIHIFNSQQEDLL